MTFSMRTNADKKHKQALPKDRDKGKAMEWGQVATESEEKIVQRTVRPKARKRKRNWRNGN